MRWFLTDSAPALLEALRVAGEEAASPEDQHAGRYVRDAMFHPAHYPLDDLGAPYDVVVLVDPIRMVPFANPESGPNQPATVFAEFGYARGHGKKLRNRGVTLVMYAADGAKTLEAFRAGMYRRCACEPADAAVIVVPDEASGDLVRASKRVARWNPGEGASRVVEAVRHAREGRIYSPRRDGRLWG